MKINIKTNTDGTTTCDNALLRVIALIGLSIAVIGLILFIISLFTLSVLLTTIGLACWGIAFILGITLFSFLESKGINYLF